MKHNISDLLAVLAHEMRTPIAAILGYQELLYEGIYGKVDERGKEPLERIAFSARQLLHLIDGVQEIGTPPEKRLHSSVESFDPSEILRSCLSYAQADATGRNITLEATVPDQLPEVTGDPDRFCRAIDLALAAAIKTSHGATLSLRATETGDHALCVTIDHTGLAPERDDPALIDRPAAKLTGAGLRLAIVREIARQMHGDIELAPSPSGTSVVLHFRNSN